MKKASSFVLAALLALPAAAASKQAASKDAATATATSTPTSAQASTATQASTPAQASTPTPTPAATGDRLALDLSAAAYGGAFDGMGVRKDSGSMLTVEASGMPELRRGAWTVEAPFRFAHRETFGAQLPETTGALDVAPWLQATESLRLGVTAGISGRSRQDWEDLYQPQADGSLAPTDRYSYLAWRAGVAAYARPGAHQHLRARYRFASYDYDDDPNFDPNAVSGDPMHLTPGDNGQHQVDVSWSYRERAWALVLRVDYTRRNEAVLLARTAGSGSTRAGGPGTPLYTTPLQRTTLWEPSAELRLEPTRRVELSLRYGVDLQEDLYQGYYSFTQHHPRVTVRWAATRRLALEGSFEGWLRTYGPDGTSPDRLDGGTRRTSSRVALGGSAGYRLAKGLRALGSLAWLDRGTNYPDYVSTGPDANSSYDIDWDYTNVTFLAGLEYRL